MFTVELLGHGRSRGELSSVQHTWGDMRRDILRREPRPKTAADSIGDGKLRLGLPHRSADMQGSRRRWVGNKSQELVAPLSSWVLDPRHAGPTLQRLSATKREDFGLVMIDPHAELGAKPCICGNERLKPGLGGSHQRGVIHIQGAWRGAGKEC
jgi:hypothetical protein